MAVESCLRAVSRGMEWYAEGAVQIRPDDTFEGQSAIRERLAVDNLYYYNRPSRPNSVSSPCRFPRVQCDRRSTMRTIKEAASEFLANKRIAVTGVSRNGKDHGANTVYKRLRDRGYEVFAVNPSAEEVEGDRSYHDLTSIPGGVGAVVIATAPSRADDTMRECDELGIKHVWMHRGPGPGSVSGTALAYGRERGITVIDGGCPLMFAPTADFAHKVMKLFLSSHVPKTV